MSGDVVNITQIKNRLDPQRFIHHYAQTLDPQTALYNALTPQPFTQKQLETVNKKAFLQFARRLLLTPDIAEQVNTELVRQIHQTRLQTTQWVLQEARTIYEKCTQQQPILNPQTLKPQVNNFQPTQALRALELVGKHVDVQAFKETLKIETADDDLEHLLDQARKRRENAQDADYTSTGTTHINTYDELLA